MKLPIRQSRLHIRKTRPKYIVIHQTTCQYPAPDAKIDSPKFQVPALIGNVLEKKQADINYHFIIDKIKDDYQIITCKPFVTICEFPDISNDINDAAFHVAVMGSYDFKIPEIRLYEILAYRLLNPLLKAFHIIPTRIYLHYEVSDNKEETCPGSFFNKGKMISMIKRFIITK